MVERLWCHALEFLDNYRLSSESPSIQNLYKYKDNTGILEIHKKLLAQSFIENEVDMKIMFYELIRMLTNYEREHSSDEELYDYTRSITKIEGYQDLTNRLQRFLNQRFMLDIDELNKKCMNKNESTSFDNQDTKFEKLEAKVEQIMEDNKKLKIAVSSLSTTNQALEREILELKNELKSFDHKSNDKHVLLHIEEIDSVPASKVTPLDKANVKDKNFSQVNDKMQSLINQVNTLLINDATHLERIFNLESQVSDIHGKLLNLESADLYLQEAHKVLTERTSLIEKYSKYIEEKVKLVSTSPITSTHDMSSVKFEDLIKRISSIEKTQSKHLEENYVNRKSIIKEHLHQSTFSNQFSEITNDVRSTTESKSTELSDRYQEILCRILKMEELLSQQAQTISDFSDKYFKLLANSNDKLKQTEITKLVSEKLSKLTSYSKTTDITKINTYGLQTQDFQILDFIEIVVGMNKSLNQMLEDFNASQITHKLLKAEQMGIWKELKNHNRIIAYKTNEIKKFDEKLEKAQLKEVCEYEKILQRATHTEELIRSIIDRIVELERHKDINKIARRAEEEDFSIDANEKDGFIRRKGSNKWFGTLFGKHNSCCC